MEKIEGIAEIAENTDEVFWIETKKKCVDATAAEQRNLKINETMIALCDEQLKLFGEPNR